jgi:hypothetical protein
MPTPIYEIFAIHRPFAKLTDSQTTALGREHLLQFIRYRAYELYAYEGPEFSRPTKPAGYDRLVWSNPHGQGASRERVETDFRARLAKKPKDRLSKAARFTGWTFTNGRPDESVVYTGSEE